MSFKGIKSAILSAAQSHSQQRGLIDVVQQQRAEFAAKVRAARAVLGWSQRELAEQVGMTQRSIHRIEQGTTDVRRSTVVSLEHSFAEAGLRFETMSEGGFKLVILPMAIKLPIIDT